MNFRLLHYFLAVASNLSFSRAAENLHVAQSTLSQQIQQLEEYYGVLLFNRQGRTISLTPAGLELQEFSARVLDEEEQLRRRFQIINAGKHLARYPLRIFFDLHMTRDPYLYNDLTSVILELQEELKNEIFFQPVFQTQDLDEPRTDLNEVFNNSQVDFWLIGAEGGTPHGDIKFEVIYEDRFSLMISKHHPLYHDGISLSDLPNILENTTLYLLQNRSKYLSEVLRALPDGDALHPGIRFESSADVISFYVDLGSGVSIIPENTRNAHLNPNLINIPIPNTHFYTLAGYRLQSQNPILPLLSARLKERIKEHGI